MTRILGDDPYRYAGSQLFIAPFIHCSECSREVALPYGELPQRSLDPQSNRPNEGQILLPPDGWRIAFGCLKCGLLSTYGAQEVEFETGNYIGELPIRDDSTFFSATVPCADTHCPARSIMYTSIETGGPGDIPPRLQSGFFRGNLLCGHPPTLGPEWFYKLRAVSSRLW